MTSPRPQLFAPVARALREALEAVASAPVRESVIARALHASGLAEIPEAGPEVMAFADGELRRALSDRVGDDVANEVLEQVRPVLERAASRPSLRPAARVSHPIAQLQLATTERSPRPARAALAEPEEESGVYPSLRVQGVTDPAPSAPMPTVFLASRDAEVATALAHALGGRATVRVIDGLLDLLEAVDEDADARRAIVLDATRPSIQVRSLLTVAPELAGRTKVVVWRALGDDQDAIVRAPASTSDGWVRCTSDVVSELADACVAALA